MESLKFILVDDNQKYRESLKFILTVKLGHQVIAEASNGEEFLNLPFSIKPDIVLMDLSMPVIDGFTATKKYFWRYPNSKIIAVSNHQEQAYLLKLVESGFKGFILKNNFFNEIKEAIEKVNSGKLWFDNENLKIF